MNQGKDARSDVASVIGGIELVFEIALRVRVMCAQQQHRGAGDARCIQDV